jgi:hypothetical protein
VLAFKRVIRAVPMVGILAGYAQAESKAESDAEINLWADSVGEAFAQLGLVLTVAIIARLVIGMLSGLVAAL